MSDIAKDSNLNSKIFKTNRDKIIELLLNEIIYLDQLFYTTSIIEKKESIKIGIEKLENLLKIQGYMDQELNDIDYKNIETFIYRTLETVKKEVHLIVK